MNAPNYGTKRLDKYTKNVAKSKLKTSYSHRPKTWELSTNEYYEGAQDPAQDMIRMYKNGGVKPLEYENGEISYGKYESNI